MIQSTTAIKNSRRLSRFFSGFFVFTILLFLTTIIRLPDISMPLERDEGEYAYAAQDILRGAMPYRDSFCQKPPLVFIWYILAFKLLGETDTGIHLTMVLFSTISAFGLYIMCRYLLAMAGRTDRERKIGKVGSWFAAVAFTLSAAGSGYFGSAANTEIFMLAPVVFGTLFILKAIEEERPVLWFLTGFLLGAAFMTKQVALLSFAGPGLFAAWILSCRKSPIQSYIKLFIFGFAGIVVAILPFVIWFLLRGILPDFLAVAFQHNLKYIGSPLSTSKWINIFHVFNDRFLFTDGLLWLSMILCIFLILFTKGHRRNPVLWFIVLWFTGSLFGVALGPYTFGHYFLQSLPPLVIASGVLFYLVLKQSTISPKKSTVMAIFMIIIVLAPMVVSRTNILRDPLCKRSFDLYSTYGPSPFLAAKEVGEYIRKSTEPWERILIIGSEPEIFFYSRRRSSTRYTIFYPLTGPFEDSNIMIEELFEEIMTKPPVKVIIVYCKTSFITGGKSTEKLKMILSRVGLILKRSFVEEDLVFTDINGKTFWKERDRTFVTGLLPLLRIYSRK